MALNNQQQVNINPTFTAAKCVAEFLPTFDGANDQLESFINRCDKFYNSYGRTLDNNLSEFVFNVISSKLKHNVYNFIMCRPDIITWPLLKTALRNHYGDKIDRQTMMREFLQMTKHRHESILDFLERMKLTKSKVEVKIHIDTVLTAEQKRLLINQNELNALDILAANSDDGLRLILDIRTPATLAEASEVVTRHFHNDTRINNLFRRSDNSRTINKPPQIQLPKQNLPQFKPIPFQNRATFFPPNNPYIHRQNPSTAFPNYPPQNMFSNQSNFNRTIPRQNNFPSQPIPIQTRPIKQHFPTNQQVFGKPQPQKNVFAPKNDSKPRDFEPMDTSSAHYSNKSRNFFRPNGQKNFISQELNNVEGYDEESYGNASYDPSYNYEMYTNDNRYTEYAYMYPAEYTDEQNDSECSSVYATENIDNNTEYPNFRIIHQQSDQR